MTKSIFLILAGAAVLLAWRWIYLWRAGRIERQAFEYRMRNRQDLK